MNSSTFEKATSSAAAASTPSTVTSHWGGVYAMTLCVFTLIASEFMPVSLLTPIAAALQVSEGGVGYGIAISGALAVLTSLSITRLAGNLDRKMLLLGMTALMGVSGLVVALATNYVAYMVGRALIGVVVGGFWSMSAAVAMRLVPAAQVPKALAIFNSGNALATVIAAPLGSYLGGVVGWRGAFFCLVPIAVVAFVWQWISLPSLPLPSMRRDAGTKEAAKSGNLFGLLRQPVVALGMVAVGLFFMGQFELFTYVRPFLERITQVDLPTLSMVLFGMGVAGFVGTALVSRALKHGMYRMLIAIPLLMAVIALALTIWGASLPVVVTLLALWALVATAAPVGWWSWLAHTLPKDAEVGGGLMVAVIQLSIALGSTVGGLLFDGVGYRATFAVSAALLVAASGVALLTARYAQASD